MGSGKWMVVSILTRDVEKGERWSWMAPLTRENNARCQEAGQRLRGLSEPRMHGVGPLGDWNLSEEVKSALEELGAGELKLSSHALEAREEVARIMGGALEAMEGCVGPSRQTLTELDLSSVVTADSVRALMALRQARELEAAARPAPAAKRGAL